MYGISNLRWKRIELTRRGKTSWFVVFRFNSIERRESTNGRRRRAGRSGLKFFQIELERRNFVLCRWRLLREIENDVVRWQTLLDRRLLASRILQRENIRRQWRFSDDKYIYGRRFLGDFRRADADRFLVDHWICRLNKWIEFSRERRTFRTSWRYRICQIVRWLNRWIRGERSDRRRRRAIVECQRLVRCRFDRWVGRRRCDRFLWWNGRSDRGTRVWIEIRWESRAQQRSFLVARRRLVAVQVRFGNGQTQRRRWWNSSLMTRWRIVFLGVFLDQTKKREWDRRWNRFSRKPFLVGLSCFCRRQTVPVRVIVSVDKRLWAEIDSASCLSEARRRSNRIWNSSDRRDWPHDVDRLWSR